MLRRQISLTEWQPEELALSAEDALTLAGGPGEISVAPMTSGRYRVVPSHWVGTLALSDIDVLIRPKVGVNRLFHLLSSSPRLRFGVKDVPLDDEEGITEAIIRAFLGQLALALRRGPLRSYRNESEALPVVRGRIRLLDQARRRFNLLLPVEVSYDEFTTDVDENRILKAALRRIERMRLRDSRLIRRVGVGLEALQDVADVRYDRRALPEVKITRLNRHYEPAVILAKAIIASATPDLRSGRVATPNFLLDMDKVFEDFVYRSVADRFGTGLGRWKQGARLHLDERARVVIKPDLSLWYKGHCRFVGDVKYKRTEVGANEDLYQAVAYAKALGQSDVVLIYAESSPKITHKVRHDGTRIHLLEVDLAATIDQLEAQMGQISETIADLAGADSQ